MPSGIYRDLVVHGENPAVDEEHLFKTTFGLESLAWQCNREASSVQDKLLQARFQHAQDTAGATKLLCTHFCSIRLFQTSGYMWNGCCHAWDEYDCREYCPPPLSFSGRGKDVFIVLMTMVKECTCGTRAIGSETITCPSGIRSSPFSGIT